MYTIYIDDTIIHAPGADVVVLEPVLDESLTSASQASFKLLPTHPQYNSIHKLKSVVRFMKDSDEIFRGRVLNDSKDLYNIKHVIVEDEMNYFIDSTIRPYDLTNTTLPAFLQYIVNEHNQQVDEFKTFTVGNITVDYASDTEDDKDRSSLDYTNTKTLLNEIQTKYGGYYRIRHADSIRYLDYIADYTAQNSQQIVFGENLLDITQSIAGENVITVLVPLGATDNAGERLTIEGVNNGKDYLVNPAGVAEFGRIERHVIWEDIDDEDELLTKGQEYLSKAGLAQSIELKAVDLNLLDASIERFALGDWVHVRSTVHNIDSMLQVRQIKTDLAEPDKSEIVLGLEPATITGSEVAANDMFNVLTKDRPAVTIVASGNAGNWHWRKYSDGTFDAWFCDSSTNTYNITTKTNDYNYRTANRLTRSVPSWINDNDVVYCDMRFKTSVAYTEITSCNVENGILCGYGTAISSTSITTKIMGHVHGTWS